MKMYESVAEYYAGKSIFITGGTGFLGKVVIEKLLRSCPEINNVYVLVRELKGLSAEHRIQKLTDNPLFSKLKEKRPNDLKKLIPVCGDIGLPNLGISPDDEAVLIEKVAVVIHAAATVKFNEPLKVALKINVDGTRTILDLCHRMAKLEVFLHISTAFANTDKPVIEEIVYPPPAELDDAYAYLKQDEEDQNGDILNGRPNTYTYTKAIAETVVERQHGNIPTIIIRPSIVAAVISEPEPGWVSNWYGASGLLTATAKGLNRVIYADPTNVIDLIPSDYVANLIIAAAAKTDRSKSLVVYHSCSSESNPLQMGDLFKLFVLETVKNKTHIMPRPDLMLMTKCYWLFLLIEFVFQVVPSHLLDFWLLLQGKPTRYAKIQALLKQNRDALTYFTSNSWVMKTAGISALASSLSPADYQLFPCRPRDINWREYIPVYWAGIQRFLEKKT